MNELNEETLKKVLKENLPTTQELRSASFGMIYFTNKYFKKALEMPGLMAAVRKAALEKYNEEEYDIDICTKQLLQRFIFAIVKATFKD